MLNVVMMSFQSMCIIKALLLLVYHHIGAFNPNRLRRRHIHQHTKPLPNLHACTVSLPTSVLRCIVAAVTALPRHCDGSLATLCCHEIIVYGGTDCCCCRWNWHFSLWNFAGCARAM
jgi:hypothetical protein